MITWILAAVFIIFCIIKMTKRHKNFPPGPRGLPLVGYAPFLSKKEKSPQEQITDLSDKYGPVVGVYFGTVPLVMINGYQAVKEVLTNDLCNGRPTTVEFNVTDISQRFGILFIDGDFWKEQRRFSLWHLRDFGFGRGQMEEAIHSEIAELLEYMENKNSEPLVATDLFGVSIINVLWAMMAGKRYQHGDEGLTKMLDLIQDFFRSASPIGGFWGAFPRMRKVFASLSGYDKEIKTRSALEEFIRGTIKQHKELFDENSMRDFMDTYIKEMRSAGPQSTFTETQLAALCMDMFMAGSETTTNFLGFSVLHLVRHPDVQKKVQAELDQVVGRSRLPDLKDRVDLPYTEATIWELFRLCSIAPFTPPHRAVEDTDVMGTTIPKDAFVMINLWSLHMDKDHWGDPKVFRPERFIKDGKFVRDDQVMPFGTGKRACAGEALARATSFLFFTSVIQKFNLSVPPGQNPPDDKPLDGITLAPKPFSVQVTLRN